MNLFSLNKRFAAFTVTELMVGMVISGIVLSAIWTAFHLIGKRAAVAFGAGAATEEISFFYCTLSKDFYAADSVRSQDNFILFTADRMRTPEVKYQVLAEYVVRTAGELRDTFRVRVTDVRVSAGLKEEENIVGGKYLQCDIKYDGGSEEIVLMETPDAVSEFRSDD